MYLFFKYFKHYRLNNICFSYTWVSCLMPSGHITTDAVSSNLDQGRVYNVKKSVSDLQQVASFLRFLRLPPPIKMTATI